MVDKAEIVERLKAHAVLGGAPVAELEWLASNGELQVFGKGEPLTSPSREVTMLNVVLTGRFSLYVYRGRSRRRVMEWIGGEVTGTLPYSRLTVSPGHVQAEEWSEVWAVSRDRFPEMIRECPEVTAILVHVMTDRARHFTSSDLRDEKVLALGKLAAGLAHELNNPASAIVRSTKELAERFDEVVATAKVLTSAGLTPAQFSAVEAVRDTCLANPKAPWTPLERVDREEAFAQWIERSGGDPDMAGPLAESSLSQEALDRLGAELDRAPLIDAALRWAAASCAIRVRTTELDRAAARIFEMVDAVKSFTHMDRAMVAEPVSVGAGLESTVAVLRAKAAMKSINVRCHVDPDLPPVHGVGAEINQIWANLIDNALDAVEEGGHIDVIAGRDGRRVVVEIVDDGPGIPTDIRGRIFDPFFTTKGVDATGLGLDVVRRSLEHHDGEIDVESRPGRTVFRVRLPAEGIRSTGRWSRSTARILIEQQ